MNSPSSFLLPFHTSLLTFQSHQFFSALILINSHLQSHPLDIPALINRSSIHLKLSNINDAQSDLQRVLQLDPYSYAAYFNLASIFLIKGDKLAAFQNLCCSLSCLYLQKAKITQQLQYISRALFHAENNVQAYMLKSLIHLKHGHEKLSLASLQRARELVPHNQTVKIIHLSVYNHLLPYHQLQQSEPHQHLIGNTTTRLISTCDPSNAEDIDTTIDEKICEFNLLVGQLGIMERN